MNLKESHRALIEAMRSGVTIEHTHSPGRYKTMTGFIRSDTREAVTNTVDQLIKGDYINGKTFRLTAKGAKYVP